MSWYRDYVQRFYASRPGWVHGTKQFYDLCRRSIEQDTRILEVGPGPSNKTSRFLAGLGELDGVDLDAELENNDALTHAWQIESDDYPVPESHYAACVSNYVVEHVTNPQSHLREIHRVLRPGGRYIFRTPNRYHYVALVASLTPHWFHRLVANRLRGLDSEAHDPYPTVYRINSRTAVRKHAEATGFEVEELQLIESTPSYGAASRVLFLAGMAYERFVTSTERLAGLRANLLVILRKQP